ncbi:MAG: hypothetical protein LUG44_00250 [Clostridiales bacterium]|nr:hypothetical protein [Clostridiales bacterium]
MATYYEFKKLICLILGDQVSDNNDDDICVPIAPYPYCHGNSEKKVITITICDAELRHLFDEVSNYSFEKTELFLITVMRLLLILMFQFYIYVINY